MKAVWTLTAFVIIDGIVLWLPSGRTGTPKETP
jgi:hypothetical protein